MDMLTTMMKMQEQLNTNVINKLGMTHYNYNSNPNENYGDAHHIENKIRREFTDNFLSALQAEVCEAREALTQRVKWWKNKTKNDAGVREELIDIFHFLMSSFLSMGMTAEDVYNIYCEKNKLNFIRKDWKVNDLPSV